MHITPSRYLYTSQDDRRGKSSHHLPPREVIALSLTVAPMPNVPSPRLSCVMAGGLSHLIPFAYLARPPPVGMISLLLGFGSQQSPPRAPAIPDNSSCPLPTAALLNPCPSPLPPSSRLRSSSTNRVCLLPRKLAIGRGILPLPRKVCSFVRLCSTPSSLLDRAPSTHLASGSPASPPPLLPPSTYHVRLSFILGGGDSEGH